MRLVRAIACGLLLLLFVGVSAAQGSPPALRISAAAAEKNLKWKIDPIHPARPIFPQEGIVIIAIVISPQGQVSSERAISGHPAQIRLAMDAVYQWRYQPFILQGQARAVTTLVRVPFSLGPTPKEDPAFTAYDEQETKCQSLLDQQSYALAKDACASLPQLSEKARVGSAAAYGLSGLASFKASDIQDALVAWQHQLAITKDEIPGEAEAHFNVARALQATGDFDGARSHYEHSVSIFEAVHHGMPDVKSYSENLRTVLLDYAALLQEMGKQSDAEAMEKKAQSIERKPSR